DLDIANLTREQAIEIYRRDWWERYRIGEIEDVTIASKVLDLFVNVGPIQGATIVQRALHACGRRDVEIDGIMGSQPLAAINSVRPRSALLAAIKAEAAAYYRFLVERRPELRRFEQGWITRAYSYRKERVQMMNRRTLKQNLEWFLVFLIVLMGITFAAAAALAAHDVPGPDDELWVTFGAITIAWASAQMGILQVLKAIHIGGKPVLGSPGLVWLANGILGVIGMTIAATQAGVPLVAAIIQAIIA